MTSFSYEPLQSVGSFRLLQLETGRLDATIECKVRVAYLHQGEQYEAISYAWGRGEGTVGIKLNGRDFKISWMVADILMRLRHREKARLIWIDLLCIDQSNISEKSKQIPQMKYIFGEAQVVIASLGPHQTLDSTTSVLHPLKPESVRRVEKLVSSLKAKLFSFGTGKVSEDDEKALLAVLSHPWFDRVWVVQEAGMAQRLHLLSGAFDIDGEVFAKLHARLAPRSMSRDLKTRLETLKPLLNYMARANDDTGRSRDRAKPELLDRLQTFRPWKATDPRDKIYALLDLSEDGPKAKALVPDYNLPIAVLYRRVAQYLMQRYRTPDVLMYALREPQPILHEPKLESQQPQGWMALLSRIWKRIYDPGVLSHRVPSWCPDWRTDCLYSDLSPTTFAVPFSDRKKPRMALQTSTSALPSDEPFDLGSNMTFGTLMVSGIVLCTIASSQSDDSYEVSAPEDIKARMMSFPSTKITQHLQKLAPHVRKSVAQGLNVGDHLCLLYQFSGLAILRPHGFDFTLVWLEYGNFRPIQKTDSGYICRTFPGVLYLELMSYRIRQGAENVFTEILDELACDGTDGGSVRGTRSTLPTRCRILTIV